MKRFRRHPRLPDANNKALAVVGSGPSGMSAAYFGALLGYAVTLFEAGAVMGGILRGGIPRYLWLPKEVVHREFDGLSAMGICLRPGVRIGKDITLQDLQTGFDFVFLGTGAHRSLRLHLDHEEASPRILSGLNMLKKEAEGRLGDLGKKVVVIGGGNTAIDAARTALRKGADVTVVYRRTSEGDAGPPRGGP